MGDIVFHPGVQFKSVEGNALLADGNVGEKGADFRIEAVAVHTEISWCIANAYEPR